MKLKELFGIIVLNQLISFTCTTKNKKEKSNNDKEKYQTYHPGLAR